uniref:Protein shisa-5 n=1 Tax=Steinernema glaseri TaxID=37863 RepID=A0A1I8AGG2_9BILA
MSYDDNTVLMVAGVVVTVCIVLTLLCVFVCVRSYRWYQNQLLLQRQPQPEFPTMSVAYSAPTGAVSAFPAASPPEAPVKVTFNEPPPPYPGFADPSVLPTYDQLPGSANSPTVSFRAAGFYRTPDPQHVLPQKQ